MTTKTVSLQEGLVSIFEEMKRRWELTEKKRVEERKEGEKEREGRRIVRGSKVGLPIRNQHCSD